MNKLALGILSLSVFLTASCEDPAANKPKAQTTAPTNTATNSTVNSNVSGTTNSATTMQVKGTALPISPENSKVEFTGSKVTGKHDGGFKTFTGTIDLVNNKAEESQVTVEIDVNSMFTDNDQLTEHLKTPDFFDAAKYPKAGFVSTKIVPDAAKGAGNFTITGDFDLHGQKRSITFPAKIEVKDDKVEVDAEFSINRKEFGIVYAGKTDDLIRDDVVIRLDLESPRKK